MSKRRRTNVFTVDAGPDQPARFYRLIVGGRGADEVREDVLIPDGDKLKSLHHHEERDEAA